MAKDRASINEYEERINKIIQHIVNGATGSRFIWNAMINEYKSYSTFQRDLRKARKELVKATKAKRSRTVSVAVMRYNMLFNKSLKIRDYRECRAIQAQLDKIQGNNEAAKIDLTTGGKSIGLPKWIEPN